MARYGAQRRPDPDPEICSQTQKQDAKTDAKTKIGKGKSPLEPLESNRYGSQRRPDLDPEIRSQTQKRNAKAKIGWG